MRRRRLPELGPHHEQAGLQVRDLHLQRQGAEVQRCLAGSLAAAREHERHRRVWRLALQRRDRRPRDRRQAERRRLQPRGGLRLGRAKRLWRPPLVQQVRQPRRLLHEHDHEEPEGVVLRGRGDQMRRPESIVEGAPLRAQLAAGQAGRLRRPGASLRCGRHLVDIVPKAQRGRRADEVDADAHPTFKEYAHADTPTWGAVAPFMETCHAEQATLGAPFDQPMKLVLNIAVGGYGGAPCSWGETSCTAQGRCGGSVGSEMVVSDVSVWEFQQ
mmetsp:Transcript_2808/g.7279  ORF Transcript_2808/g.7279 Transcript_2808/m.7279 type:complete len:272 (-) Transcript_2808:432-1247(-)